MPVIVVALPLLSIIALELRLRVLIWVMPSRAETCLILMAVLSLRRRLNLAICFLHDLIVLIVLPLLILVGLGDVLGCLLEDLSLAVFLVVIWVVVLLVHEVIVVVDAAIRVVVVLVSALIVPSFAITVIPVVTIILVIVRTPSV